MPKRAKVISTFRAQGGLMIDIKAYCDGRFGFDWLCSSGETRKIRLSDCDAAMLKAQEFLSAGKAGRLDLLGVSERDFTEFLQWRAKRRHNIPDIPSLVDGLITSKEGKGRSEWTLASLRTALIPFAKRFPCPLEDVTREEVESWLNGRNIGPRRFNNIVVAIVSLCRFARHEGHLGADLLPIERISRRFHRPRIETYTPDELRTILNETPREWVPTIVLGAFAGLRPEECAPDPRTAKPGLTWQNINWRREAIDVPREVAKDGRRRDAPLLPAAQAYLQPWRNAVGRVSPIGTRFSNAKRYWGLSVPWRQDALRHSFASYRLALIQSIPQLSIEMGNSIAMCKTHYLDAKFPEEADEWFGLRPSAGWNSTELFVAKPA